MKKLNQIEVDVISWNQKYPVDAWWRRKYNVPFMSRAHREISFLEQLFDFFEDKMMNSFDKKETYQPNVGEFLKSNKNNEVERLREEFEREFLDG